MILLAAFDGWWFIEIRRKTHDLGRQLNFQLAAEVQVVPPMVIRPHHHWRMTIVTRFLHGNFIHCNIVGFIVFREIGQNPEKEFCIHSKMRWWIFNVEVLRCSFMKVSFVEVVARPRIGNDLIGDLNPTIKSLNFAFGQLFVLNWH